ncbi:MAG: hypothetical protein HYS13_03895 [Planctomycetia bacterium]|nr:hypothetical protein [Planctomycetia bacterium]
MSWSKTCRAAALWAAALFLTATVGCADALFDLLSAKPAQRQVVDAPSAAPVAAPSTAFDAAPAPTAENTPSFPAGGGSPEAFPVDPGSNPAPPTTPAPSSSTPGATTAPGADVQLHLKAGVALPQTGPNGTLMGFSVDYYLIAGSLHGQARYAKFHWVVEGAAGFRLSTQIPQLKQDDNLLLLQDGWRPENGPYRSYVVEERRDGKRVVVSNVCPMR